jgi:hypothetical protein
LGHLFGGRLSPHVELIDPLVFLFLIADLVSNRGLTSADCRYETTLGPEALPRVILLLFPYPRARRIALLPSMNPTTDDTEYLAQEDGAGFHTTLCVALGYENNMVLELPLRVA